MPGLTSEDSATSAQAPASADVPADRRTPRATMRSFLSAMNEVARGNEDALEDALACMDLSELATVIRHETGVAAAVQLKEAMDRLEFVDATAIPNQADAPAWTFASRREGRVRLVRGEDGAWVFDAETVRAAPLLYAAVAKLSRLAGRPIDVTRFVAGQRLRQLVPKPLREVGLLLEHWQWLGLLALAFAGVLGDRLSILLLTGGIALGMRWRKLDARDTSTMRKHLRPVGLLAMAGIWVTGLSWLGLPEGTFAWIMIAARFVLAAAAVWGAWRLVDVLGDVLTAWADGTESALDDLLVPLVVKSFKVFVAAMGLVFLADQLELRLTPLLTGLGLGGLAFALAAKDMLGNFFGSIMIIADRTFQVGDWIVVGDVEGTVEQVGFRSTRVRTFYNSLMTLPNTNLVTSAVDNLGRRRWRRWRALISLTYDTPPERIEAFCEGVRELVRRHPYTRKDYFQVYLNAFAPASLDVLVYVFFETPDWSTELRERQRLMLDIMRLARQLGVEFAFPTQTLHVRQEQGGEVEPEALADGAQRSVSQHTMRGRKQAREIMSAFGLDEGGRPP
ncbi:MAG: mechanosensitive ion channel family protein, partial [Planctomycetota bacterium]